MDSGESNGLSFALSVMYFSSANKTVEDIRLRSSVCNDALFSSTVKLRCVRRGMSVSGRQHRKGRSGSADAPPVSALPPAD